MAKLLPLAAMDKLMKESGANRVSKKAAVALKEELEEIASELAEKAVKFSKHAGRRTVQKEDVKLAAKS